MRIIDRKEYKIDNEERYKITLDLNLNELVYLQSIWLSMLSENQKKSTENFLQDLNKFEQESKKTVLKVK